MSAQIIQESFGPEWEAYDNHEVNGVEIRQRRDDGYIDATAMCKAYETDFAQFHRTGEAEKFIEALSKKLHICSLKLVQVERGRKGRTWVHPQIALRLAIQLDAAFAVDVTAWVFGWLQANPDLTGASFQTRRLAAEIANAPIPEGAELRDSELSAALSELVGAIDELGARIDLAAHKFGQQTVVVNQILNLLKIHIGIPKLVEPRKA
jgi:hypothetical protein